MLLLFHENKSHLDNFQCINDLKMYKELLEIQYLTYLSEEMDYVHFHPSNE
jgi:hypothetical protein